MIMDRETLTKSYIEAIIDGMDHKDLWQFVYDTIENNLETYTDEDGNEQTRPVYQGIDQSKLVPLLVKTIQELEARIAVLEAE